MVLQGKAKREIFGKRVLCPDFGILSFPENKLLGATKYVGILTRVAHLGTFI